MQEYDQQRKRNAPLDEIDQEAKEEAEYLLKRANELRQEQEDEVKHLNEVRSLAGQSLVRCLHSTSLAHSQCQMSRHTRCTSSRETTDQKGDDRRRQTIGHDDGDRTYQCSQNTRGNRTTSTTTGQRVSRTHSKEFDVDNVRVFCFRGASLILKQIEENEKEKVYKEEVREQENVAMFDHMQKLQEKDWEEFSKRKEAQKILAVSHLIFVIVLRIDVLLLLLLERSSQSQSRYRRTTCSTETTGSCC